MHKKTISLISILLVLGTITYFLSKSLDSLKEFDFNDPFEEDLDGTFN